MNSSSLSSIPLDPRDLSPYDKHSPHKSEFTVKMERIENGSGEGGCEFYQDDFLSPESDGDGLLYRQMTGDGDSGGLERSANDSLGQIDASVPLEFRDVDPEEPKREDRSQTLTLNTRNVKTSGGSSSLIPRGVVISRNVNYSRTGSNPPSKSTLVKAQSTKYNPQGSVEKNIVTAKKLEFKDMQSRVNQLKLTIETMTREKKTLETMNKRQEKALKKYEGSEADLPKLMRQHRAEVLQLRDALRKAQIQLRETSETLRHRDQKIIGLESEKKRLGELVSNDSLEERSVLQEQLKVAQEQVKSHEEKVAAFANRVQLIEKNYSHQMANESIRFQRVSKKLFDSKEEIERLKILLRDKERTINYLSMNRGTGRPEPPRITYQKNHAYFRAKQDPSNESVPSVPSIPEDGQKKLISGIPPQVSTSSSSNPSCKDYYFREPEGEKDHGIKEQSPRGLLEVSEPLMAGAPQGFGNSSGTGSMVPETGMRLLKLSQISDNLEQCKSNRGESRDIDGYFLTGLQTGFFSQEESFKGGSGACTAVAEANRDFFREGEGSSEESTGDESEGKEEEEIINQKDPKLREYEKWALYRDVPTSSPNKSKRSASLGIQGPRIVQFVGDGGSPEPGSGSGRVRGNGKKEQRL